MLPFTLSLNFWSQTLILKDSWMALVVAVATAAFTAASVTNSIIVSQLTTSTFDGISDFDAQSMEFCSILYSTGLPHCTYSTGRYLVPRSSSAVIGQTYIRPGIFGFPPLTCAYMSRRICTSTWQIWLCTKLYVHPPQDCESFWR